MSNLERFMSYAQAFEETYVDDDWSRLEEFFAKDAVYEVTNIPYACRVEGRDAILRGIKKSLDGFDRQFPRRDIELTGAPEETDGEVSIPWAVEYERPGAPPVQIRGRSRARYDGDVIVYLSDAYEDDVGTEVGAWLKEHGKGLDPSYV